MLDEQHVDDVFSQFVRSGNGSDDIKQIYNTLPYFTRDQIRCVTMLKALGTKYESPTLLAIADSVTTYAQSNRKTGFRFTRLIESYSLYKHFKGYQAKANIGENEQL